MASYMDTSKQIQAWCLAQTEPFSYIELVHAVQPLVDACDCSREDVVVRAFGKLGQDGLITMVTPRNASVQKYFSIAKQKELTMAENADEISNNGS